MIARIPLGRYGEPPEVGRVVAFLLSPAASYVNGVVLGIDGGIIAASPEPSRPRSAAAQVHESLAEVADRVPERVDDEIEGALGGGPASRRIAA